MSQINFKNLLICFIILINYCAITSLALKCYTCGYVAPDKDQSCIKNPESVSGRKTTVCSKKYCTIIRQETLSPAGKVVSFLRGCEDKPLFLNEEQEDSTHKYYYRSCTTDLCNSGNGISSADSSSDAGAGDNMIVPGRNITFKLLPTNYLIFILIIWNGLLYIKLL